jgi:hypothetical protein
MNHPEPSTDINSPAAEFTHGLMSLLNTYHARVHSEDVKKGIARAKARKAAKASSHVDRISR